MSHSIKSNTLYDIDFTQANHVDNPRSFVNMASSAALTKLQLPSKIRKIEI
ncbi:hypothetical protein [Mycoplasmopsis bovirhinis]|uniref:hypothetical protein n=1 Tax=Mycoplasmopsis bovirhinis TaxID=29553 RepID=UPI0013EA3420|nr:hypothetical protein [Mycoplasmopsis bovirhinis]